MASLGRIFGTVADISRLEDVRALFAATDAEFGGLDILVNNAGQGRFKKVGDMTPEERHLNIDLNLNGAFYCAHEALARFTARGGGFIVNISSLAARNPFSGGAAYNASKFGLNGFTEALMLDHRSDNIRVCSIMPGSVDTGFSGTPGKPRAADTSWMIAPRMSPRRYPWSCACRPGRWSAESRFVRRVLQSDDPHPHSSSYNKLILCFASGTQRATSHGVKGEKNKWGA
jgi:NAD(P)-dependent dehydrogenase (short-subunit alcohol dehydrogenase family)